MSKYICSKVTKTGTPKLIAVTTIYADRFSPLSESGFSQTVGFGFYNDDKKFMRDKTSKIIAYLPGDDWVVVAE